MAYEDHPIAALFPLMSDAEVDALAADIKAHGMQVPIVLYEGKILDGRNRYRACQRASVDDVAVDHYEGDDPVGHVVALNLHRRHLTSEQRACVAVDMLPMLEAEAKKRQATSTGGATPQLSQKIDTAVKGRATDKAAQLTGTNRQYVSDAKRIKEEAPAQFEALRTGTTTLKKAKAEVRQAHEQAAFDAAQAQVTKEQRQSLAAVCQLRHCSCRDLLASGIQPDVVITDPPYPKEYLPVFTELAEACAAADVPLVAVMSGQSYLPEVYRRLGAHLPYRWTMAYYTPGGQAVQQWQAQTVTNWKPVLIYGTARQWLGDVVVSKPNDNDKRFHRWGQSESGLLGLVERLSQPGQLVCDPFVGGGSTAWAALTLCRRFVGADIDAQAIQQTQQRLEVAFGT